MYLAFFTSSNVWKQNMRCLFIFLSIYSVSLNAQSVDEIKSEIKKVRSVEQADRFLAKNQTIKGTVKTFNSLADTTFLHKKLLALNHGEVYEFSSPDQSRQFICKILEKEEATFFRVKYIFLDSKKLSVRKIDSLRKSIFKRLDDGEQFESLAKIHSMDANAAKGGDLGWFGEGATVKEFEDKVRSQEKGKIFKVDVPDQKWYYVVKKTHDPAQGTKIAVLYLQVDK